MKVSAVMVTPVVPLDRLPPQELDAVRRFLFQHIRGLDEEHSRRWRRFWGRLVAGEVAQFYPVVDRSLAYHRRHMVLEGRIFENQDGFLPTKAGRKAFREWLKVGAALFHVEMNGDAPRFITGSLSYEDLSDDEMRSFHEAAMEFLHSPRALRKLWPAVKPANREAMLEACLIDPNQETQ